MKTSTKFAVALVALAGVAGAGLAAQAESRRAAGPGEAQQAYGMFHHSGYHGHRGFHGFHHGRGGPGGGHMFGMLEDLDANNDGKLSQEEIDQARSERFDRFDADSGKALTLQEYEQLWLDAMRERMVRAFQRLDRDGDAKVTAEEFQAPYAKMVRRMDRNDDGVIDRNDFKRRHRGERARNGDDNG